MMPSNILILLQFSYRSQIVTKGTSRFLNETHLSEFSLYDNENEM